MVRSEGRRKSVSLIFLLIGIAAMLPMLSGMTEASWVYALFFIGCVTALTALTMFFIFKNRAKVETEHFIAAERLAEGWPSDGGKVDLYRKGMILDGEMYLWDCRVSHLEGISRDPDEPGTMLVVYRLLGGRRPTFKRHFIEVIIPSGQEAAADEIIRFFGKPLPEDFVLQRQGKTVADTWETEDVE